jgi:Endopolygalacturonase
MMDLRKCLVPAIYVLSALLIWAFAGNPPAVSSAGAGKPGLYRENGAPHTPHTPNRVTGRTINVLDYGADPRNNSTDDRPAIQAAIQAAKPGDEVYLPQRRLQSAQQAARRPDRAA